MMMMMAKGTFRVVTNEGNVAAQTDDDDGDGMMMNASNKLTRQRIRARMMRIAKAKRRFGSVQVMPLGKATGARMGYDRTRVGRVRLEGAISACCERFQCGVRRPP